MPRPYAVSFTVSDALWMTTVGDETPLVRKRHRGRLRAYGRQVWAEAKEEGAGFTNRFVMLVTVGGRRESPVLSCETLKPLIDAGTDMGLWPDDDPAHRAMTCYLRDPRPLPGGRATINIWVIPLAAGEDPLVRLLRCTQDQLESCIQIVRLQLQRLVQIFHAFFLRRDLFGEIQIIVRRFRRRFFLLFAF